MNYHDIHKQDMLNGDGIRVTLFVSGCEHHCLECQNPITWNLNNGILFDKNAYNEIINELNNDWCSGLTLSGGDPLHIKNRKPILKLLKKIKKKFPCKTIWCYTGYLFEDITNIKALKYIDILIDGKYIKELRSLERPWIGSSNQRIIDCVESLKQNKVILIDKYMEE